MSPIYLREVPDPSPSPSVEPLKIILRDGKVAADEACCCNCGCFLPYTATIVLDGLVNKTHTNHCILDIFSTFGSGAFAVGMAPGGCDDFEEDLCGPSNRGPLTQVLLVDGGSGYAKVGRVAPTLTVTGSGQGATFVPTLQVDNSSGCPVWSIQSISVTGGTGYKQGEILKIKASQGDTTQLGAIASVVTKIVYAQPTVTASIDPPGQNAEFSITLLTNDNENYFVSDIDITAAGSGYFERYPLLGASRPVEFNTPDSTVFAASADVYPVVTQPTQFEYSVSGGGQDYNIEPVFEEMIEPFSNAKYWRVINIDIIDGGINFSENDFIEIWADGSADFSNRCNLRVSSVDINGSILTLEILFEGVWRECVNGDIDDVTLTSQGLYYKDIGNGEPLSVNIFEPGQYYREDPTVAPCVANVFFAPCGGGFDAEIEAVIDDNLLSPTFGQITALNIINQGDDYLVWRWVCSNHGEINGLNFVLRAQNPRRLVHLEIKEKCFGSGATAFVDNKGPRLEPTLTLATACSNDEEEYACGAVIDYELSQGSGPYCNDDYWTISSIELIEPNNPEDAYCFDTGIGVIMPGCYVTVEENGSFTYAATGGTINNVTLVNGGKYYKQLEWDGQPSPIYSVSLTNPGGGYAMLGRQEPNLTLDVLGGGSGASFNFDIVESKNKCDIPYWIIKNLTIDDENRGSGYTHGASVVAQSNDTDFVVQKQMVAYISTRRPPEITASIQDSEGSGASIEIEITSTVVAGVYGWKISSVSGCGGQDYTEDAEVMLQLDGGTIEVMQASFAIQIVKGKIICITINSGGLYYIDDGSIQSVTLLDGGMFYVTNKDLPPYVDDVKVIIHQEKESDGNGAIIQPVVDDDPYSVTFGEIKELNLINCGTNYSYFGGPQNCQYSGGCESGCSIGGPLIIMTMPNKKDKPINITLSDNNSYLHFRSSNIPDCNNPFPSSAELLYGAPSGGVSSITAGGIWDSSGTDNCPSCVCPKFGWRCNSTSPVYCVTMSITDFNGNIHNLTPIYSLDFNAVSGFLNVNVDVEPPELDYIIGYGISITCSDGITEIMGGASTSFAPETCPTSASGRVLINSGCICNPDISGTYNFTFEFEGDPAWFVDCPLDNLGSATVTITQSNGPC